MTTSLLDYPALRARGIPYSRIHLRRLIAAAKFPAPITVSVRPDGTPARIAWPESEIDEWIEGRIAECDRQRAGQPRGAETATTEIA